MAIPYNYIPRILQYHPELLYCVNFRACIAVFLQCTILPLECYNLLGISLFGFVLLYFLCVNDQDGTASLSLVCAVFRRWCHHFRYCWTSNQECRCALWLGRYCLSMSDVNISTAGQLLVLRNWKPSLNCFRRSFCRKLN